MLLVRARGNFVSWPHRFARFVLLQDLSPFSPSGRFRHTEPSSGTVGRIVVRKSSGDGLAPHRVSSHSRALHFFVSSSPTELSQ
jgi:hypothetical protein